MEMDERRKRKDSVIFRGVIVESNEDARSFTDSVNQFLLDTTPPLSDLFCIDRSKGLYRVKITDDETRSKLIKEAKNLKDHQPLKGIYINTDFTYKQRNEQNQKRQRKAWLMLQLSLQPSLPSLLTLLSQLTLYTTKYQLV